jgi:hypothetical protein
VPVTCGSGLVPVTGGAVGGGVVEDCAEALRPGSVSAVNAKAKTVAREVIRHIGLAPLERLSALGRRLGIGYGKSDGVGLRVA